MSAATQLTFQCVDALDIRAYAIGWRYHQAVYSDFKMNYVLYRYIWAFIIRTAPLIYSREVRPALNQEQYSL